MGFFGKLMGGGGKQVSLLEEADAALTKAFETKNVAGLDKYFTRSCLPKLAERIRAREKLYSGIARYRHIEWTKLEESDGKTFYKKSVTYDNIQISKGISAPVGTDHEERWTVIVDTDGSTKVSEVRRVSNG